LVSISDSCIDLYNHISSSHYFCVTFIFKVPVIVVVVVVVLWRNLLLKHRIYLTLYGYNIM